MKASKLVIKDVLAVSAKAAQPSLVDVVVEGSRISSVIPAGPADTTDAKVIDGHDRLLIPGIVNSHTHSSHQRAQGHGRSSEPSGFHVAQPG